MVRQLSKASQSTFSPLDGGLGFAGKPVAGRPALGDERAKILNGRIAPGQRHRQGLPARELVYLGPDSIGLHWCPAMAMLALYRMQAVAPTAPIITPASTNKDGGLSDQRALALNGRAEYLGDT